jgi:hypothetical protein
VRVKAGPERVFEALIAYLPAEQRLGRVAKKLDLESVVTTLVGGCFQIALLEIHWGQKLTQAEARRRTEGVVQTLLGGIAS